MHLSDNQFSTLKEIGDLIEQKLFDPQFLLDWHAWFHREEPFDQDMHESDRDEIEKAWLSRFASGEHDAMSQTPAYIGELFFCLGAPYLCVQYAQ